MDPSLTDKVKLNRRVRGSSDCGTPSITSILPVPCFTEPKTDCVLFATKEMFQQVQFFLVITARSHQDDCPGIVSPSYILFAIKNTVTVCVSIGSFWEYVSSCGQTVWHLLLPVSPSCTLHTTAASSMVNLPLSRAAAFSCLVFSLVTPLKRAGWISLVSLCCRGSCKHDAGHISLFLRSDLGLGLLTSDGT